MEQAQMRILEACGGGVKGHDDDDDGPHALAHGSDAPAQVGLPKLSGRSIRRLTGSPRKGASAA